MKEEWRHQWRSPLIWGLFIGSLIINLWFLFNYAGQRDLVLKSRNAAAAVAGPVTNGSVEEYLDFLEPVERKVSGNPTYRQMMEGAVHLADTLDAETMADTFSESLMLSDGARDYAEKTYQKLDPVLNKNRKSGAAQAFFVPCSQNFFELFSRWLPLACTLEGLLAGIFIMMRCINEPFATGTALIVYATKTGRNIRRPKAATAVALCICFTSGIWALTMAVAALVFPLGSLWDTPLGSMMALDSFFPVISWFPVSVRGYLGLEFVLSLCVCVLFSCFSYWFVTKTRNSFTAFVQLGFVCALIYTITSLSPRNSNFYFLLQYNPVDLARKAGHWLVSGGSFLSPPYYEFAVLLLWGLAAVLMMICAGKRFLKEDL